MEDNKCGTEKTENSSVQLNNAEHQDQNEVPSSITVTVPSEWEFEEAAERRVIPKGLLAVLISMGVVLIAGIITLAVLLITQPNASIAVGAAPAVTQTTEPLATPSPTPKPTPTPTPVPTTAPEASDDFSSIFEAPDNEILQEAQNQ